MITILWSSYLSNSSSDKWSYTDPIRCTRCTALQQYVCRGHCQPLCRSCEAGPSGKANTFQQGSRRIFSKFGHNVFWIPEFSVAEETYLVLISLHSQLYHITPPSLLASLKHASSMPTPLACCLLPSFFLALLMLTYLYFFLLFLPFFDFDSDIVCFQPVFFLWVVCCLLGFGFCCDSFSIW